jgi:hypothetical protein
MDLFDAINFNTTIADYTMDELFSLLSITVTPTSNYEDIKKQIELSTDNYIKQFQSLGKPEIVQFFKNVKTSLIGIKDTVSTSESLIIDTNKAKDSNNPSVGDGMYNSNNGPGNPIYRKTITKLLNVDTRFRGNYLASSSTNYIIDLPDPINNVIEMTLSDLELPSTYYPITAANQNNYFWIKTTNFLDNDSFYYIVIPDGNYYFQTLVEDINNIFKVLGLNMSMSIDLNYNNVGGIGEGTGLTSIGILTVDDISNNSTNLGIKTFEIKFNASIPTAGQNSIGPTSYNYDNYKQSYSISNPLDYKQLFGFILGYRNPVYSNEIRTGINSRLFYKSESIIDISGPKYLFLVIDDGTKSVFSGFSNAADTGNLSSNIIARISIKGQLFSIQSQNDFSVYSQPRYYNGPVNIKKIAIQLLDEYSNIVNLNNKDFSFTLKMTIVYSAT